MINCLRRNPIVSGSLIRDLVPMATVMMTVTLLGCGTERPSDMPSSQTQLSIDEMTLPRNTDYPCENCTELVEELVFGDVEGPGYVVATSHAVVDSDGRYWVGQYRDMIKVFDHDGTFLQVVGRAGQGPMEFNIPSPIASRSDGSVVIVDPINARLTIVGPDFEMLETQLLPGGFNVIAPLRDDRFVVNFTGNSPDGSVQPLHLFGVEGITKSFGADQRDVIDPRRMRRVVASGGEFIVSMEPAEFDVSIFDQYGDRLGSLSLPRPAEREVGPTGERPAPSVIALRVDSTGERLYVLMNEVREDWVENSYQRAERGRLQLLPKNDDLSQWYTTRIDVVDLLKRERVSTIRADRLMTGFVSDRLLMESRVTEQGFTQLGIWRLK